MVHDLDSLRCFECAARSLNFRAAAKEVALSPPAFSDRIRRLEEELNAPLFLRTTRSVSLTPAGARLLPAARALLAQAANLAQVVHTDQEIPYELKVGTRFELGLSWLLPALRHLEVEKPERTVHLSFGDSPDLLARTQHGLLDATVTSARLSSAQLDAAKLHEEQYVFVSAPAATLLEHMSQAPEFTLIDASPELPLFRYFADAGPTDEDWRFGKTRFVGAIAGIRTMVLAGEGVAVLPLYLVHGDLDAGSLVPLFPKRTLLRDFFRLVFRTGHPHEHHLRALAEDLRRQPLQ